MAEVEDALKGTTLDGAPMVPVSAVNGDGLPELLSALDELLESTETRKDSGRPRLSIDRAFTMPGFGTVVTGTLIDGSLSVGQEVQILPSGRVSRIRGLQSHRQKIETSSPGRRLAVNLSGVSHDDIQRGEVLTIPRWLRPTIALDVRLQILADAPRSLKHNRPVTFHSGSREANARVRLLETEEAQPGEETWAQVRLESPMPLVKGDYFVIRSSDATIGGGTVVEPHAKRHRRRHSPTLERLEVMERGSEDEVLLQTLQSAEPCDLQTLANRSNISPADARTLVDKLTSERRAVALGSLDSGSRALVFSAEGWATLSGRVRGVLESYHRERPLRVGIQKEELRSRLNLTAQQFQLVLPRLTEDGVVAEDNNLLRLPQHSIALSDRQRSSIEAYLAALRSNPYSPPTDTAISDDLLNLLIDEGRVIRLNESVVYDTAAYEEMVGVIVSTIKEQGKMNVGQVRDQFQTSRKYALSLLEHLDQQRVTRRVGDDRVLR